MSTIKKLDEKLQAKSAKLKQVFDEAKTDDGEFDFTQVKCLGDDYKTSAAVCEKVNEMNDEINAIGEERDAAIQASEAEKSLKKREEAVKRPAHADPSKGNYPSAAERTKALGEMTVQDDKFKAWQKDGAAGGVRLSFPDAYPSDFLAKGAMPNTMGTKALFETGAGWAPESLRVPGFVEGRTRPIQLLDIIPLSQTGFETVKYMEETTRTHGAAEAAEGATFAESTFVLTERNSPVEKITDSLPVTDEQLEDVAQVESYINGRLNFGLRQRLDSQVLLGDGVAPNLRGIFNTVGIQTQAKALNDPVPDEFFKAMTLVRLVGRAIPTHHIIHPTDWQSVRLLRTTDGLYIWGNPSEAGPERMWGLPVVQADIDAVGRGLTGSFEQAWIDLAERRGVDIQVGFVGTQFLQGRRTVRGDMRAALVVRRPSAFVELTALNT